MANTWGNSGNSDGQFPWAPKLLQMVTAAIKLKDTLLKKSYDQPRQHIKKQRHYFANKGPVVVYAYDSWTIKTAEHQRMVLSNGGSTEDS